VATLSFEDPSVCLFSNPPDSGADPYDGCTDGDLIVSLRWDSYGSRTKTILSDGTIVYSRAATVSGSVTFNGSPLFDPAILTTAEIQYDPPGSDTGSNINQEYVVIKNTGEVGLPTFVGHLGLEADERAPRALLRLRGYEPPARQGPPDP